MREGVLFARIGLSIVGHHRVMTIPVKLRSAAVGVYLYSVAYARANETDGDVPQGAVEQLGATREILEWLVRVGLFARKEENGIHGYLVVNYAEFNETRSDIEARRAKDRARWNARKGNSTPRGVHPESGRSTNGAPPLQLCSETETDLREEKRERSLPAALLSTGIGAPVPAVAPLADESHRERAREQITRLAEWAKANGADR